MADREHIVLESRSAIAIEGRGLPHGVDDRRRAFLRRGRGARCGRASAAFGAARHVRLGALYGRLSGAAFLRPPFWRDLRARCARARFFATVRFSCALL
jgi:hypothetical protein